MNHTTTPNWEYTTGDFIEYATYGGTLRAVEVDQRKDDIKCGLPGFTGTTTEGARVWGYDYQITTLIFTDATSQWEAKQEG
tara:strand:+ start:269 stop:511 length:243 start_codon:yes stop_codon:yes gene_type:complete